MGWIGCGDVMQKQVYIQRVKCELEFHIPFTIFSAISALIISGFLLCIGRLLERSPEQIAGSAGPFFHIFHPSHILLSAMATTAMFYRYERNFVKAVVVGALGALIFCQISDILLPYLGGMLSGADMKLHIELLHQPELIFTFLLLGILGGLVSERGIHHSTVYSHSGHVFVSTIASLSYMVSYGFTYWFDHLSAVVVVLAFAVWLPCCFSDVIFPLLLGADARAKEHEEHLHTHPRED